jgi:hypothetical protein
MLGAQLILAQSGLQSDPQASSPPLSRQEKFDYYLRHSFSFQDVLERSALSGIAQWRNTPPEW